MDKTTVHAAPKGRKKEKPDKYIQELRAKMPKKLNKLGEWFFSSESDYQLQINDMKAVLK